MSEIGAGGQGSSSSGSQLSYPLPPVYTSPAGSLVNNLFGVPTRYDPTRGGFTISGAPGGGGGGGQGDFWNNLMGGSGGFNFANPIFTPDSFAVLRDQLDPVGDSPFLSQALGGLDSALGLYDETLLPGVRDLANTGFRTDVSPIAEQMLRQFQGELIPGLAEKFSFLGGGGQTLSSDFGAAAARAGGDLFSDIGALQVGADEAAAGRRVGGLELGGLLGQERAALPLEVGAGAIGIENMWQNFILSQRPGGQLISFIERLLGVERDPIVQPNVSIGRERSISGGGDISVGA